MTQSSQCLIAHPSNRVIEHTIYNLHCLTSMVIDIGVVRRLCDHSNVASSALRERLDWRPGFMYEVERVEGLHIEQHAREWCLIESIR